MTPTRTSVLLATAVISAVAGWLILHFSYTSLPPLPWTAALAMLLLGIAEALSGWNLRARLRGQADGKPLAPIAVARMAALAKASSHAAAVLGGLAAGFLSYLAAALDKSTPRSDAFVAGGTVVAAMILVAGALYLERSCRVPDGDRDAADHDPVGGPPASGPR